jgi:hypothetical protein
MSCCVKNAINSNDEKEVDKKMSELVNIIKIAQDK